jgi:nitronate monooxygenase
MAITTADGATTALGCALPVVLAGMGGVARADLVAAVTDAGGFGFLGMVREPPTLILRDVEALRRRGYGNFGVNIIPAATAPELLERQLATIIDLHVPAVTLFWDLDERVVGRLRDAGITVVCQVGSAAEAIAAERAGAELIIAQGVEAGGHVRGTTPLRVLLPEVVAGVRVPVLAAGGLATGADMVAAFALGAEAVVLGTALMATHEAFAHDFHKQRLVEARGADTVLTDAFHINWPPGAPVRVLRSEVTAHRHDPAARIVIGEEEGRPIYRHSTDSPLRSMTGDFSAMALYAGTGVGAITAIEPAATRIRRLVADAEALLATARPPALPQSSSAVCYVDDFAGAYTGTLTEAELTAELVPVAAELAALLRDAADDELRSFPATALRYAPWLLALRETTGAVPPARAPGSAEQLLARLGGLLPRLAETPLRQMLLDLRLALDRDRRAALQSAGALA